MRELTKIIVTGAAGFVGTAVQIELRRAFYPVTAVLRPSSDPQNSVRLGAKVYRAEIQDTDELRAAFAAGVDAVVHLVGIIEEDGTQTYERVHVEGTRVVVELANEFKLKKLVHMSALGTRPNAVSRYHKTKWQAEELVRTQAKVPYTILRPSVIYGDGSEFMRSLELVARTLFATPVIGEGQGKQQPVWVNDVARAIRVCIEDERTDGKTYELGGPEVFTLDDMFRQVEKRLKMPAKRHIYLPLAAGSLAADLFEAPVIGRLAKWLDRNVLPIPRVNHEQLIMMQENNTTDMAPAREVFDWDFRRFSEWLNSPDYVEKPWRAWRSRWLIAPADGVTPIQTTPPK